ncbi:MAG: hypothetical protein IRZ18_09330 [Clostridia bacterium]|nr:hypothetical protein [Clostridia bacterium]
MVYLLLTLVFALLAIAQAPELAGPGNAGERWTFGVLLALAYALSILNLLKILPPIMQWFGP